MPPLASRMHHLFRFRSDAVTLDFEEGAMEFNWENGFQIQTRVEDKAIIISANREGLLSLSNHLKALSEEKSGSHIHLDEHNSLEEASVELIIEKIESS